MSELLKFSPSPHIHTSRTTPGAMAHVLIALVPAVFCALYFFGLPALWVLLVSISTCVATEWLITKYMLRRPLSINDYSAVLTGVLLALNLPSNLPLWMVAVGAVIAIGIAKMAFGGLGCNIFNPALVGRVFLFISFSAAMSTWLCTRRWIRRCRRSHGRHHSIACEDGAEYGRVHSPRYDFG